MTTRLTRRDAVAALVAAGVTVGAGAEYSSPDEVSQPDEVSLLDDQEMDTVVALARVLYPSEVDGIHSFVERYVAGRARAQPEHVSSMCGALEYLDDYTQSWHDVSFADLPADDQTDVLQSMGVDDAESDPDGSDVERVRFYLVNELLFALYSSPTGGRLVGIENPPGHPGGLGSYRTGGPE